MMLQGILQLDVKFHMQYIQSLVYLDVQLGTAEAFLYYYYSWILTLGIALRDHPLLWFHQLV